MKMIFAALLFPFATLVYHDFHVSITTAEYDLETRNLEITMKLFTEDLEMALENDFDNKPNLGEPDENMATDSLIFEYLKKHLVLKNKNEIFQYNFIGKEVEQNNIYIYLKILDIEKPTNFTIKNTVFFDYFDDQSNIFNLKIGTEIRSVYLEKSHPEKQLR